MQFSPQETTRKKFAMRFRGKVFVLLISAAVVAIGLAAASHLNSQQHGQQALVHAAANRVADANDEMARGEQETKPGAPGDANTERKRQIADDSAKLLKLAGDLKTEVDKTSQDTLSLRVIRKAEEIEKLARSVKEKMKVTMGGN